MTFACSAHLLDAVDAINLTTEASALRATIKDIVLRETVRDYFVNQQFRRDIFVKGPRPLAGYEQAQLLREQGFVMLDSARRLRQKGFGFAWGGRTRRDDLRTDLRIPRQ